MGLEGTSSKTYTCRNYNVPQDQHVRYTYKVGHLLLNGTYVWGKKYSFRAPPSPGQESLQRIIIFGDMGKQERDGSNEYADYQPGSLLTTDQLVNDLDNFDIVFLIGDLPYANGYVSQWDQFTAQVAPITSTVPFMIARFVLGPNAYLTLKFMASSQFKGTSPFFTRSRTTQAV
nr:nucleotide pyrophosphatase/phosphodiesterase-like [Ipomoea batatas]GME04466.1 nucleotide pyrophosphatase/phosphodiesterase-like [Ipomoea batatas]